MTTPKPVELRTDVLVVGAGAAGIRAAVEARRAGVQVLVAVKGRLGYQGSTFCPYAPTWGYQASMGLADAEDSPEEHLREIADASWGVADLSLADILVHEAAARLEDLRKFGLEVDYANGAPVQEVGCFSRRPRCFMVTGKGRIRERFLAMLHDSGAKVLPRTTVTDLLIEAGECVGALAWSQGQPTVIWAKAVILATGGGANLFAFNFNTADLTGDGQAMALRAGATLTNLEFYQIGFGLTHPLKQVLFEGRLLRYGPDLLNRKGEPFLERYLPEGLSVEECISARSNHMPFSIRDNSMYLDIASHQEVREGRGTPHRSVVADFRRFTAETLCGTAIAARCFEGIVAQGVDITQVPIEIALHVHALNGGILIDGHAQSEIPGLFAAGEVAAGPHGADRLGGNMMPTTQVFGARAGHYAAKRAAGMQAGRGDLQRHRELLGRLHAWSAASPAGGAGLLSAVRRRVRLALWRDAVVGRNEAGLARCAEVLGEAERILGTAVPGRDGSAALYFDLRSMTELGQAIVAAARLRRESRGSHHRSDFPLPGGEEGRRPIMVRLEGGETTARFGRGRE